VTARKHVSKQGHDIAKQEVHGVVGKSGLTEGPQITQIGISLIVFWAGHVKNRVALDDAP